MRGFISRYLKFVKSQIEPSPSELKGLFILIFIALLGIGYDYYQKITSPVANIKEAGERKPLREGEKININKASISELTRLPGVGPRIAEKIYEYRKQVGKFKSIEELLNVKGIGPKKLEKMRPYITL
jgi:comEA protein